MFFELFALFLKFCGGFLQVFTPSFDASGLLFELLFARVDDLVDALVEGVESLCESLVFVSETPGFFCGNGSKAHILGVLIEIALPVAHRGFAVLLLGEMEEGWSDVFGAPTCECTCGDVENVGDFFGSESFASLHGLVWGVWVYDMWRLH